MAAWPLGWLLGTASYIALITDYSTAYRHSTYLLSYVQPAHSPVRHLGTLPLGRNNYSAQLCCAGRLLLLPEPLPSCLLPSIIIIAFSPPFRVCSPPSLLAQLRKSTCVLLVSFFEDPSAPFILFFLCLPCLLRQPPTRPFSAAPTNLSFRLPIFFGLLCKRPQTDCQRTLSRISAPSKHRRPAAILCVRIVGHWNSTTRRIAAFFFWTE